MFLIKIRRVYNETNHAVALSACGLPAVGHLPVDVDRIRPEVTHSPDDRHESGSAAIRWLRFTGRTYPFSFKVIDTVACITLSYLTPHGSIRQRHPLSAMEIQ